VVKKLIISLAFATVASSSLASQDPTAPLGWTKPAAEQAKPKAKAKPKEPISLGWRLENAQTREVYFYGEHLNWAEMLRYAEYAIWALGVVDDCLVVFMRSKVSSGRMRKAGCIPIGGKYVPQDKVPLAYRKAKADWERKKRDGMNFGRQKNWPLSLADKERRNSSEPGQPNG